MGWEKTGIRVQFANADCGAKLRTLEMTLNGSRSLRDRSRRDW